MPGLSACRLTCQSKSTRSSRFGERVRLLGDGALPSSLDMKLSVLPLRLTKDSVLTRSAGMASMHPVLIPERGDRESTGSHEARIRVKEQKATHNQWPKDAGSRQTREFTP